MGSSQSKVPDAVIQEKLLERLQALHMKNDAPLLDKDYVYVEGESRKSSVITARIKTDRISAPGYTPFAVHKQDVSATTLGEWEKELMEDPKVGTTRTISATIKARHERTDR